MKLYQDEKHKKGRRTQKYYGDSPTSTLKKAAARISFIKGFQNTEVRILELNTIVSVPKKRGKKYNIFITSLCQSDAKVESY